MAVRAKISSSGELSLPAELRERHGLVAGAVVLIDDTGDGLVIRTWPQAVAHARAMSRRLLEGKPELTVDDFIADRRAEAARE